MRTRFGRFVLAMMVFLTAAASPAQEIYRGEYDSSLPPGSNFKINIENPVPGRHYRVLMTASFPYGDEVYYATIEYRGPTKDNVDYKMVSAGDVLELRPRGSGGRGESPGSGGPDPSPEGGKSPSASLVFGALAQGLAKGLSWTEGDQADVAQTMLELGRAQQQGEDLKSNLRSEDEKAETAFERAFSKTKQLLSEMSRHGGIPLPQDPYEPKSVEPRHRSEVQEARRLLLLLSPISQMRMAARDLGLQLTERADEFFRDGKKLEGSTAMTWAWDFADLALGWDPYTGPSRAVLELSTGKNFFTGEDLNGKDLSRSAISLSLAIHKLVKNREAVLNTLERIAQSPAAVRVATAVRSVVMSPATSVLLGPLLLGGDSPRPRPGNLRLEVEDRKLKILIQNVWHRDNDLDSTYLPRRILLEKALDEDLKVTPDLLGLRGASKREGQVLVPMLQRWLQSSRTASAGDRMLAEMLLRDLNRALSVGTKAGRP